MTDPQAIAYTLQYALSSSASTVQAPHCRGPTSGRPTHPLAQLPCTAKTTHDTYWLACAPLHPPHPRALPAVTHALLQEEKTATCRCTVRLHSARAVSAPFLPLLCRTNMAKRNHVRPIVAEATECDYTRTHVATSPASRAGPVPIPSTVTVYIVCTSRGCVPLPGVYWSSQHRRAHVCTNHA